jgi:hypothetical protein
MKTQFVISRFPTLVAVLLATGASMSCMTTYDSAGRPVQSVDPGVAIAGAAAAGLVGYAIANDNDHRHNYYGGGGGYYRPHGRHHRRY